MQNSSSSNNNNNNNNNNSISNRSKWPKPEKDQMERTQLKSKIEEKFINGSF